MTLFQVILEQFDGDEAVARRYCRDRAKHYRELAKQYPNLEQLADGYLRAAANRSSTRVPAVRAEKRRVGRRRKSA